MFVKNTTYKITTLGSIHTHLLSMNYSLTNELYYTEQVYSHLLFR